jgi:hypothetical protein
MALDMRPSPGSVHWTTPRFGVASRITRGNLYHSACLRPVRYRKKRRRGRDSNPRSRFIPTRRFSKPVPSANSATSPGFGQVLSPWRPGIPTSSRRDTSRAARHAHHPADDTSSRLFSFHQPGGGGGIRTPGAFTRRFSRPLPSTTRPLLRGARRQNTREYRVMPFLVKVYCHKFCANRLRRCTRTPAERSANARSPSQ